MSKKRWPKLLALPGLGLLYLIGAAFVGVLFVIGVAFWVHPWWTLGGLGAFMVGMICGAASTRLWRNRRTLVSYMLPHSA
jgi:hypothetical protein